MKLRTATIYLLLLWPALIWAGPLEDLHNDILYVTVRIRAGGSVGSGVIFSSVKNGDRYDTYVLTNHHVISDAIQITDEWDPLDKKMRKKETRATIEVEMFKYQYLSRTTGTMLVLSDIVEWDKAHDLALIKMRSDEFFRPAKLYPKDRITDLKVFDPVWVCGSGLGRSPFPTSGHIASLVDEIDNLPYYMLSAPAVFGNSGGGAFLASTREFIGIPSRIAVTYVSWAPNAVYHMNYIIPIDRIYSWLSSTGWAFLFDPAAPSHEEWLKRRTNEKRTAD